VKTYDATTLARLEAGQVDYLDALTLVFDSGTMNLVIGMKGGSFAIDDPILGPQTFHGVGGLVSLDVPDGTLGNESQAITATLVETYLRAGSDVPTNVFDDGVRATIDEESWENREAILSVFWRDVDGTIIEREQVAMRQIDAMPLQWDENGNPMRRAVLEEPDVTQRDVEGKTANAEFQALVDPDDKAFEHVGTAVSDKIYFGQAADATATSGGAVR